MNKLYLTPEQEQKKQQKELEDKQKMYVKLLEWQVENQIVISPILNINAGSITPTFDVLKANDEQIKNIKELILKLEKK